LIEVKHPPDATQTSSRGVFLRGAFLFADFFLIIMAYYQVKPASRSLFIEHLGADLLPYVWIGTATILGVVMTLYHHLVATCSRYAVVLGTCWFFLVSLLLFGALLANPGPALAVAFYILVDILGVVLVEQFWSLTNSLYTTHEGKRWYGLVGSGGLAGGVAGGALAAALLQFTPLRTADLLWVAAAFLGLLVALTTVMARLGLYRETTPPSQVSAASGWRVLGRNRYLLLVAGILLVAQLAEPVVEYQFLKSVEQRFSEQDTRTAFLSAFFSILGLVSIGVNLIITPGVHRFLGVIAGLMAQPLALALSAIAFMAYPTLLVAGVMKTADRGLSYSINRASRELLYVPIAPRLIYQAKAWIDMFGYRLFKVVGSVLILLMTQWLPWKLSLAGLGWLTLAICLAWVLMVTVLRPDYQRVHRAQEAPGLAPDQVRTRGIV
jgi:AAA family ATP:ADP antiporter